VDTNDPVKRFYICRAQRNSCKESLIFFPGAPAFRFVGWGLRSGMDIAELLASRGVDYASLLVYAAE
jgi:hypothetical protein